MCSFFDVNQANVVKAGLLSIGLQAYWSQFKELRPNLARYHEIINDEIASHGVEVLDVGMVDTIDKSKEAAIKLASSDVQMVFVFVSTYSLSSILLPVAQRVRAPFFLLNLQPVKALDYERFNSIPDRGVKTGIWLEHCQACSIPEIAGVFNRAAITYEIITGFLHDPGVWTEVGHWIEAMKVRDALRNGRVGVLGNYYNGMLDVYTDLTNLSIAFGVHVELLEMSELKVLRDKVTAPEVKSKIAEFRSVFEVAAECDQVELERAARTAKALDQLTATRQLGALAYYYEGMDGDEYRNIVTSVIAGNTLLTGRGIPVAGECEVKNALAMKIMAEFNAGGSFSEFYLMDFNDDVIFLGHDGPAHSAISEGKVKLVPLPVYHGKPGEGLSVQMKVRHGQVTLLSVVQGVDKILLLVAEGESVPGATLEIGNANSRYRFPIPVKEFINRWSKVGPSHHCAIGVGHIAGKIEKLGFLLDMEVVRIC